MTSSRPPICLVSSCLMGFCTRYDGASKPSTPCIDALTAYTWIPICPEQLGGLSTPRERAHLAGGNGHDVLGGSARVITESGRDVTQHFIRGAQLVLEVAQKQSITVAALKAKSPSCAVNGTIGVTAALLSQHDITLQEY